LRKRTRIAGAGLFALAAIVAVGAIATSIGSAASKDGRQLEGTVGPGFTITLTMDGDPVTSLRPGTYWLTVNDLSTHHNFHIFGPGLDDVVTTVPETGTVTVKIQLQHGTYTFQCDPHATVGMRGTFDVGGVGQVG
jgi:plastocyanin